MFTKIQSPKTSKHLGSLLILSTLMAIVAQFFAATPAKAACVYEGTRYETGDTVGPYVCMPDGSWQPQ